MACIGTRKKQSEHSPFTLEDEASYRIWRNEKLAGCPCGAELLVQIEDMTRPSDAEKAQIIQHCRKANMALYRSAKPIESTEQLRQFCTQFGLNRLDHNLYADEDGISALRVVPRGTQQEYIPYSNHGIRWHTDGYYNELRRQIRAMVLHCVTPAAQGGDNALLDYEVVYIKIRDTDPHYIRALMEPDVMTIPANVQGGNQIRPAQSGPVFSVDPLSGDLHMRYTARTRSIQWKDDALTREAVQCLEHTLSNSEDYVVHHRLGPGEGVISNNVLHSRTPFENGPAEDQQRLMYRARYYDRVNQTSVHS